MELNWELNCKHVWDCISDFLDQALSHEERDWIERPLAVCEVCSAAAEPVEPTHHPATLRIVPRSRPPW